MSSRQGPRRLGSLFLSCAVTLEVVVQRTVELFSGLFSKYVHVIVSHDRTTAKALQTVILTSTISPATGATASKNIAKTSVRPARVQESRKHTEEPAMYVYGRLLPVGEDCK